MTYSIQIEPDLQIEISAIEAMPRFKFWAITNSHGKILKHYPSYKEMYEGFFRDFDGDQRLNLSYITDVNYPEEYGVDNAPY